MAVLLGAPFLFGLSVPAMPWRRPIGRYIAHALLLSCLGVLAFAAVAEFFYWNEFAGRFGGIAVNYLIFPREVIGNIRESFDLSLYLPAVAAVAILLYWLLRRRLDAALSAAPFPGERGRTVAIALPLLALAAVVAYAGPGTPSHDREINEVADNGLRSLLRAFLTNDANYDGQYAGMEHADAVRLLRHSVAQENVRFRDRSTTGGLMRHVENDGPGKPLNIVLVINESFGSTYVDDLDNRRDESISPAIARLAREGLLFTNVYATGDRTVRGLEALLTSFAPIPGISTARRNGSEGMNSLPFLLRQFGYQSAFLYAGDNRFDNMGHFWSTIGFDHVWDERDFADRGFATIWGSADEYLYAEAMRRMDAMSESGRPAFLAMLTVSNHRPYTYPDGRIAKPAQQKRKENAATYADWAFGDFVARARAKPWFDDTVFVFTGDHGPKINGAADVPVEGFRVPLLFYAPTHIAPQRIATLGSSLDMAPTLLGLLGFDYDSPFFGVDLRHVPEGGGRIAMAHNFSVAYGTGEHVVVLEPNRTIKGYRFKPGRNQLQREAAPDPTTARLAIAQTQTAHRMFYARRYHELSALPVHAELPPR